jgi:maltose alpha-D-glucosyltransferase/alpha-amylase
VADYYRIAPRYGTNRDLSRLCHEAHRRGIKVCLDLVAGHTSVDHSWFKASRHQRRNKYSDRYIWAPSAVSEADETLSFIRGYSERGEKYVANCFPFQPALNYGFANPLADQPWQQSVDAAGPLETRRELIKIMDFWLGHGVDGFRVDMAFSLVKMDPGHRETIKLWQDIGQEIRVRHPDMVLISEWGNPEESIAAGFDIDFMLHFGVRGYPDLMLDKNCFFRRRGGTNIAEFLKSYMELVDKTEGKGLISVPSSNHDIKRPRSDGRTVEDLKVIFTFLLTWPGVPFIYYGDEIGMRYIPGLISKEGGHTRTGSRTPMQWDDDPNAGFSIADKEQLYLPLDPYRNRPTVKKQASNPGSLLNHVRKLIVLRNQSPALQATGTLIPFQVEKKDCHFAYLRQYGYERFLIVLNPSSEPSQVKISGIKADNLAPRICHGTQAYIEGDDIQIKLKGISYGVFKL